MDAIGLIVSRMGDNMELLFLIFVGVMLYFLIPRLTRNLATQNGVHKFVAREGLLILGWVGIWIIGWILFWLTSSISSGNEVVVGCWIAGIAFFSYPVYTLYRFIRWAIKTLKKEDVK